VTATKVFSAKRRTRLSAALGINVALVVGELVAALASHSSALLADAGHNLTDVAGLGAALFALAWAAKPRNEARSFGNHRATILAALFNAIALAMVTVSIVVLSIARLIHPETVNGRTLAVVAGVVLVTNAVAALVLRDGSADLNMRAAMVHMSADVLSAALAVAAGVVIVLGGHGADLADPAASLAVSVIIVLQAYRLVRASVDVLLESTPRDIDLVALRSAITGVDGIGEVHDLHVWSLSSEVRALSAHLVLEGHPTLEQAQALGQQVRAAVAVRFELAHTTLELECERCADLDDPCGMDELQGPLVGRATPG
jgi:cobalt-zinc-cadmium efflux system protein